MTEWRERGFVQDSDNEEEDLSDVESSNGAPIIIYNDEIIQPVEYEPQHQSPAKRDIELQSEKSDAGNIRTTNTSKALKYNSPFHQVSRPVAISQTNIDRN